MELKNIINMKFIKTQNDFINEKRITYKRKYTLKYPSLYKYPSAKLRNTILNAVADNIVNREEIINIVRDAGGSDTWFINNKSFFKAVKDKGIYTGFKLTDRALKLWIQVRDIYISGN